MMCATALRDLPRGYEAFMEKRTQSPPVEGGADASDDADTTVSPDDSTLTEYDKEVADSFPASDPPSQP